MKSVLEPGKGESGVRSMRAGLVIMIIAGFINILAGLFLASHVFSADVYTVKFTLDQFSTDMKVEYHKPVQPDGTYPDQFIFNYGNSYTVSVLKNGTPVKWGSISGTDTNYGDGPMKMTYPKSNDDVWPKVIDSKGPQIARNSWANSTPNTTTGRYNFISGEVATYIKYGIVYAKNVDDLKQGYIWDAGLMIGTGNWYAYNVETAPGQLNPVQISSQIVDVPGFPSGNINGEPATTMWVDCSGMPGETGPCGPPGQTGEVPELPPHVAMPLLALLGTMLIYFRKRIGVRKDKK